MAQVDAKIVEVALFFQKELLTAQRQRQQAAPADGGPESGAAAISVLLLSADNAQVRGPGELKKLLEVP